MPFKKNSSVLGSVLSQSKCDPQHYSSQPSSSVVEGAGRPAAHWGREADSCSGQTSACVILYCNGNQWSVSVNWDIAESLLAEDDNQALCGTCINGKKMQYSHTATYYLQTYKFPGFTIPLH
jgi:hypothetical protein